tara:strand:+ start:463 stop:669 length:207 start_codon:yes stop_codon:yes gene_type:complete
MRYNSPKEIGVGDIIKYQGRSYSVLVNYIIGETDKTGYTPKTNRTILIDDGGGKVVVNDYRTMEPMIT